MYSFIVLLFAGHSGDWEWHYTDLYNSATPWPGEGIWYTWRIEVEAGYRIRIYQDDSLVKQTYSSVPDRVNGKIFLEYGSNPGLNGFETDWIKLSDSSIIPGSARFWFKGRVP